MPPMLPAHFLQLLGEMGLSRWGAWYSCRQGVNMEVDMGNVENASAATRTTKTVKSLPMPKVWAFAVGQFGWALLSGIISNWLVYFYQPDSETISQG